MADLSGVTYNLLVDDNNDFSSPTVSVTLIISSTYTISSNLTATTTYYWKVKAIDGAGNMGGFSASRSFTLNKTTRVTTLSAGWNMFASPVSPDPATASYQFGDDISPVFFFNYNSTQSRYDTLTSAAFVNIGKGYWIKPTGSITLDLEGIPASTSGAFIISLGATWNQVGYPFDSPSDLNRVHVMYLGQEVDLNTAHANGWVTKLFYVI